MGKRHDKLTFCMRTQVGDLALTTLTLHLDQRTLLLGSTFEENTPLCAATWHFFEFESHICHMPTKYHIIGGSKGNHTEHRWLLNVLGEVKLHHTQICSVAMVVA